MSTNKKLNVLPIVLIIAVLLFITALYWKTVNKSNEEIVNVPTKPDLTTKTKKKRDLSFLDDDTDTIVLDSSNATPFQNDTTPEEHKKAVSANMNIAMMYNTPEKLMKAIISNQNNGNNDKVDELIAFMLSYYPDFEFPDDF